MRPGRYLIIAILCAIALTTQLVNGLNADVSWLLTVSERMLQGQELYVDIYELNPPMSALLYLPFVWLAQVLGLAPEIIVVSAVIALAISSCWLSARILRQAGLVENLDQWWLISCGALLLLPGASFGEREHVAIILILPLLAIAARRSMGQTPPLTQIVVAGLAAGLVLTIKPHFALPILLVAIFGAWRARSWRPVVNAEHVIAGLVLLGFWIVVWFCFPGFFENMLPISAATYLAVRAPLLPLLTDAQTLLVWLPLFAVLVLYRKETLVSPCPQYLAAAAGFFIAYLIQGKGFTYHLMPTILLVCLTLAWCFLLRNGGQQRRLLPTLLALALTIAPGIPALAGDPARREMMEILSPLGPGLKIANISSHLDIGSPLHRDLGGTLTNSGPCLWITLGSHRILSQTADPGVQRGMQTLQQHERDVLRRDMQANPPDVVLIGTDGIDWLAWARADPAIADMLTDYVPYGGQQPDRVHILLRAR